MSFSRCMALLVLGLLLVTVSPAYAEEPTLAFDLVPDPRPSVTDIEEDTWRSAPRESDGSAFIANLRQALQGNALAMVSLSMHTKYYGDLTEKKYPRVPKHMHYKDFWLAWAERFTSKGWVMLQVGYAEGSAGGYYFVQAADAGNAEGMYLAAQRHGISPEQRDKWLETAIAMGNGHALLDLAWAYANGGLVVRTVVKKDPVKGAEYFTKASAVAQSKALICEAWYYECGEEGHPKDPATAYVYYLLAKHYAQDKDDWFYVNEYGGKSGERLLNALSPAQMELAENTAVEWMRAYDAPFTKALEEARQRRAPLLEEFRKEMAPVIEWLQERDNAAAEAATK